MGRDRTWYCTSLSLTCLTAVAVKELLMTDVRRLNLKPRSSAQLPTMYAVVFKPEYRNWFEHRSRFLLVLLMQSLRVVLFSWRENLVVSGCATLCCAVRQNLGCQDLPSFYSRCLEGKLDTP